NIEERLGARVFHVTSNRVLNVSNEGWGSGGPALAGARGGVLRRQVPGGARRPRRAAGGDPREARRPRPRAVGTARLAILEDGDRRHARRRGGGGPAGGSHVVAEDPRADRAGL